jgi:glycine/D-amino acid oxidase-like deaminating enzyme
MEMRADLLIVGAGMVGSALAWRCATVAWKSCCSMAAR